MVKQPSALVAVKDWPVKSPLMGPAKSGAFTSEPSYTMNGSKKFSTLPCWKLTVMNVEPSPGTSGQKVHVKFSPLS